MMYTPPSERLGPELQVEDYLKGLPDGTPHFQFIDIPDLQRKLEAYQQKQRRKNCGSELAVFQDVPANIICIISEDSSPIYHYRQFCRRQQHVLVINNREHYFKRSLGPRDSTAVTSGNLEFVTTARAYCKILLFAKFHNTIALNDLKEHVKLFKTSFDKDSNTSSYQGPRYKAFVKDTTVAKIIKEADFKEVPQGYLGFPNLSFNIPATELFDIIMTFGSFRTRYQINHSDLVLWNASKTYLAIINNNTIEYLNLRILYYQYPTECQIPPYKS
ncbi:hypothetical protein B7463_g10458, partial [Scytalidium lignicola]